MTYSSLLFGTQQGPSLLLGSPLRSPLFLLRLAVLLLYLSLVLLGQLLIDVSSDFLQFSGSLTEEN